jgi:enoyl-CoA hydratase
MEMLNTHCGIDRDGRGVVRLSICNAGTLNILSSAVTDGVREGFEKLAGDKSIRAVILAGQSEKSMIGGADILRPMMPSSACRKCVSASPR